MTRKNSPLIVRYLIRFRIGIDFKHDFGSLPIIVVL